MIWEILWVVFCVVLSFFVLFLVLGLWIFYQAGKTFDHKAMRRAYLAGEGTYNPIKTEASYNLPPTLWQRFISRWK